MKFSSQRVLIAAIAFGLATFIGYRMVRPMNIFVVTEEFERPMDVVVPPGLRSLSARECGTCHREAYQEWSESMHAHAWVDPYFQVDFEFDRSQQICLNCHTPLRDQQENLVLGFRDREKFQPILSTNESFDAALRDQGVTCAVCHVRDGVIIGCLLINGVNGNRNPHICGNRKLHTSGEDVSGGADILPVMPVGRFGLDAGSGATGVLANTRREAAEPAVTVRLPHAVRPTLSSASADAPASGSCCPGC